MRDSEDGGARITQRVPIEQLEPGMTVAKPVANANGLVVLAAGVVLVETLIERLKRMGTPSVHVEGRPLGDASGVKTLAELEQELDHRFRKTAGEPIPFRIREAVRRHLRASHGAEAAV
jgi:hypothetical protein